VPVSYIVYVSQAEKDLPKSAPEDILAESRPYNSAHDITGILLFVEGAGGRRGSFMQLLEGDADEIERLRKRIFADGRHHTKVVLESGEKPQRDFADWSMAYKAVDPAALRAHPQFSDLGDPDFIRKAQQSGAPGALSFLCDFWEMAGE
jgi:hypothetical protein